MREPIRRAVWPEHVAIAVLDVLFLFAACFVVACVCFPMGGPRIGGGLSGRVHGSVWYSAVALVVLAGQRFIRIDGTTLAERLVGLRRRSPDGRPVSESAATAYWTRRSWPMLIVLGYFIALSIAAAFIEGQLPTMETRHMGVKLFNERMTTAARWLALPTVPLLVLGWLDSWRVHDRLVLWRERLVRRPARGFEVLVDEAEG